MTKPSCGSSTLAVQILFAYWCLVLLQVPKYLGLVQIFRGRPKIYIHFVAVPKILRHTKRWFPFSKFVFCAGTKVFLRHYFYLGTWYIGILIWNMLTSLRMEADLTQVVKICLGKPEKIPEKKTNFRPNARGISHLSTPNEPFNFEIILTFPNQSSECESIQF